MRGIKQGRRGLWQSQIFSTLGMRVLKIYGFVTHSGLQVLIIQTVSRNKLISENAYWGRQVPTLPYDPHKSAYNIIEHRRYYYVWTYKTKSGYDRI